MAAAPNYRQIAAQDAAKYGLGDWFVRQISQESGFDPNARSSAGAQGIAQFIPSTAKAYGLTDPFNPLAALDAAARYDRDLLKRYGTIERALSAYNSGRPDAYKDPSFAGGQTYNYVRDILGGLTGATPHPTATPQQPGAAPQPSAPGRVQSRPMIDYRPQLASLLAQAAGTQGNDLRGFYGTLRKAILQHEQPQTGAPSQPASSLATAAVGHVAPPSPGKLAIPIRGQIGQEDPTFLSELTAAARARGAVAILATSGERSPEHNAQIHGAPHSNHLPDPSGYGHALDGFAVLADGSRVPLGQFLKPNAGKYGLRSGATFTWNGGPDLVHVDDFHNGGR